MEIFSLENKIALITGSSSGLGYVMAGGLAQAGATVILNGRDEQKLSLATAQLGEQNYKVFAQQFDVTDEDQIVRAVSEIDNTFGAIDILVNNAGV